MFTVRNFLMKPFLFYGMGLLFLGVSVDLSAQKSELSGDFHKNRRLELRQKLPPNSVAVFFSSPVRNRANDVDYVYHQDPNFYYLTGWNELMLFFWFLMYPNKTQKEIITKNSMSVSVTRVMKCGMANNWVLKGQQKWDLNV